MSARRRGLGAACLVLVLGGATACGGGDSSGAATRLPSPPATTRHASAHHMVGQCHLVGPKILFGKAVDHTHPVPCSRPHNLETAAFEPSYAQVTKQVLNSYFETCLSDVATYLHLDDASVTRIVAFPIAAPDADGRIGVRCDVGIFGVTGNTEYIPPLITRTSLGAEVRAGRTWVWRRCTDDVPVSAPEHLADCERPHRAEALSGQVQIPVTHGTYPATATRSARGVALCRREEAGYSDVGQLAIATTWQTKLQWRRSGRPPQLFGACWVFRRDHLDLPARH
jgi:hypothetical protein